MRNTLRRALFMLIPLYLILALLPLLVSYAAGALPEKEAASSKTVSSQGAVSGDAVSPTATPNASLPPDSAAAVFNIYDTGADTMRTVSDRDFLRGALLCEMTLDAPEEALKAQAVAIYTFYSRQRALDNCAVEGADFTCDSEKHSVYMTDETLSAVFGDEWDDAKKKLDTLCDSVYGQSLTYNDELIQATYFAISAGCTQPFQNVWESEYPYLTSIACPFDMLYDGYQSSTTLSPDAVKSAFPDISFTDTPESWFTDAVLFESGYVDTIRLCGTAVDGVAVREALGLRSACFSVAFDGTSFRFTTLGWGHGVGMSQAGAIYLAENGSTYQDILSYFYPSTALSGENRTLV